MGSITEGLTRLGRGIGEHRFRKRNAGKSLEQIQKEKSLKFETDEKIRLEEAKFKREQDSLLRGLDLMEKDKEKVHKEQVIQQFCFLQLLQKKVNQNLQKGLLVSMNFAIFLFLHSAHF